MPSATAVPRVQLLRAVFAAVILLTGANLLHAFATYPAGRGEAKAVLMISVMLLMLGIHHVLRLFGKRLFGIGRGSAGDGGGDGGFSSWSSDGDFGGSDGGGDGGD